MNTCGLCAHWRLDGPFAKHGYGHCAARPDIALRAAICTSAEAMCRIGLFEEKKQPVTLVFETQGKEPAV